MTITETTVRLQVWEEKQSGQPRRFRDFRTQERDRPVEERKVFVPSGGVFDLVQPLSGWLPVGKYRLCLGYAVLGQSELQEACSAEFAVPLLLPGCPPLPEQGPVNTVSLHAARALDELAVCVRAINGFAEEITTTKATVRLQIWTAGQSGQPARFRDFDDQVQERAGAETKVLVPATGVLDTVQPMADWLPAGKYRLCVSYAALGQSEFQDACSAEFALPLPLPGCPPLPEQGPANTVSLHIAKAVDRPSVCVRVVNGLSVELAYGPLALTLQKWEEEHGEFSPPLQRWVEGQGQFRPFGIRGGVVPPLAFFLPASRTFSKRLPGLQPAPPGRYRACFQFSLPGQNADQQVCSEEVMLP